MSNSQTTLDERMLFVEQVYYCALYSVFVWDWLIGTVQEFRGIWKAPPRLTLAKILYICCRYWPLVNGPFAVWMYTTSHTLSECHPIFRLPVVFAVFNQFFALAAFALRTQTLMGSGARFFVSLVAFLLGVTAYQLYVALQKLAPRPFLNTTLGTCLPAAQSDMFLGYFLSPFLFMAFLTALAVTHAIRMADSARAVAVASATSSNEGPPRTMTASFLAIAHREGLMYFGLTALTYASAVGVFQGFLGKSNALLQAPLVFLFPSICACNMLLEQAARAYPGSGSASASFFMSRGGPKSRSIGFAAPTRSLYNMSGAELEEDWAADGDRDGPEDKQRPALTVDTQVARAARGSMLRTDSAASGARLLYHGQSDLQLEVGASASAGASASPASAMGIYGIACESQSGPIGFALPDADVGTARMRTPSWAGRRLV